MAQEKLVQQYIDKVEYLLNYYEINQKINKLKTEWNNIEEGQRWDRLNKIKIILFYVNVVYDQDQKD